MADLPTTYDSIFSQYAGLLPVPFLRALASRESSLNPSLHDGPAVGLLQVVPVLQNEWNQRTGDNVSQTDLLDPGTNVEIAADLLNRIIGYYKKTNDPNMQMDWTNPEFVKLLVAGWNSGYSDVVPGGGVQSVADWLVNQGLPVTHDNVFQYAAQVPATKYLQDTTRYNWQRSVADLFYAQPDAQDAATQSNQTGADSSSMVTAGLFALAGLGLAWWLESRKHK